MQLVFTRTDVHGFDSGRDEPLPDPQHLHGRGDTAVQESQDRRTAAAYIRDRRQRVPQHATIHAGPMHHHQVMMMMLHVV